MRDGLDDELWAEFAAESEEHLDTVERLLAAPPDAAAVAAVFRAFHSLKGMSSALGASGMARVAHRCEDLLGLARQSRLAMTPPLVDGLLAAVDALRSQRVAALTGQPDAPPPELLQRLEGLEHLTAPAAAPPPPAPAASLPDLKPLATMLRRDAAGLAVTAMAMAGPSAEALALAEQAAGQQQMRLAQTLRRLGTEAPLPLLGTLRRQSAALAALAGVDAGAASLAGAAASAGEEALWPRLAALTDLLRDSKHTAILAPAREAGLLAAGLGLDALEDWLLLLEDLADRVATDHEATGRFAEAAPALLALLEGCTGNVPALRALPQPPAPAAPLDQAVPEDLAGLLGAEGRQRVEQGLAAGSNLYRARLGMPASAAEEAALRGWLTAQEAETLASRTLLDTVPPELDMLILAPGGPEALAAARAAFDPASRLLLALSPLRTAATSGPEALVPSASLRVRQEAVDDVISLEAELHAASLALDRILAAEEGDDLPATLAALARRAGGSAGRELAALATRLGDARPSRARARSQLSLALRRLDDAVMELRVVPVGTLFSRLPRILRSVAQAAGKEVSLEMEGQDVRIDRALVELLADPLLHLVRNAVDHGVEDPATRLAAGKPARAALRVRAERRTATIQVEVTDDGRGIDRAAVLRAAMACGLLTEAEAATMDDAAARRLLFHPGFSTRDGVSEISGRGVGLDVVQEAVRRAGGTLNLRSTPGQGTTFVLELPLSTAMALVLLVTVAGHTYALPAARVEAVAEGGDGTLPLARLLGLPPGRPTHAVRLRQTTGRQVTLGVEAVLGQAELLLRPMPPTLAALPAVGGVGIGSNGEPVVILEPDGIAALGSMT